MSKVNKRYIVAAHHFRGNKGNKFKDKIIFVESVNGEKKFKVVKTPTIDFFVDKEIDYDANERMYVTKDSVKPASAPYNKVVERIAVLTENEEFLQQCIDNRDWQSKKLLHQDPAVHQSDTHIEDFYIGKYQDHYVDEFDTSPTIHKAYWDIENDTIDLDNALSADESVSPIDAVSVYSDLNNTMYTFLLRTEGNPLIPEFEKRVDKMIKKAIKRFDLDDCEITFYDNELDLLIAYFNKINNDLRPDIISAWNAEYDFKTSFNRIEKLSGAHPANIMCPKEFPYKEAYYYKDERNHDPALKGDYMKVASYSNYADQMLVFAALRATMGKRPSYSLDAILEEEVGTKKDELPEGVTMRTFSRSDYEKYVFYNMKDVYGLHELESQNKDLSLLFQISSITRTRVHKAWKKTTSLRNLASKFMLDNGYVMSNNHNVNKEKDDSKFKGA